MMNAIYYACPFTSGIAGAKGMDKGPEANKKVEVITLENGATVAKGSLAAAMMGV